MQSIAVPVILNTSENVVVSAPTASGKTVLAEAAMAKELGKNSKNKVLFIAPLKALTNEKESEWKNVFGKLGFKVYVVTGERELSTFEAVNSSVIITTPEKWDSATRKYKQDRYAFVKDVSLVVIDEVHLLDSDSRGGVLEAVTGRMRRISQESGKHLRVVALSATMPNISDVARWLDAPERNTLVFDPSYRPVDLRTEVMPYYPKDNEFLNKYIRLYKALDLARPELKNGHQALIFVSSRQDTYQAAEKLSEVFRKNYSPFVISPSEIGRLGEIRNRLSNSNLKKSVQCGIAFHHAGLSMEDKAIIENSFREGIIKILVSTSTLAWGVNLPARVVIVRDTELYDPIQGTKDISPVDLLQMLGRAGRPGFDTMGRGYVIVPYEKAAMYKSLLKNGKAIESVLKDTLSEHLNAEISTGMVTSVQDAIAWSKMTFLYIRSTTDPQNYGINDIGQLIIDKLEYLQRNGFILKEGDKLTPTRLGSLTSDFYLRLETAILFRQNASKDALSTDDVLGIVARAAEFGEVSTRPGEAGLIRQLQGFDMGSGGIAKVLAILKGYINRDIPDGLKPDGWVIRQNASRLLSAFAKFCEEYSGLHLSRKVKIVTMQVEKGVPEEAVSLASIDGVGDRSLEILFNSGIRSLKDLAGKAPEDLIKLGIRGQVAIDIIEKSKEIPGIRIDTSNIPEAAGQGTLESSIKIENTGGAGAISLSIYDNDGQLFSDKFYMLSGASKVIPISLTIGAKDTVIRISIDYTGHMLPVDESLITIKALKPAPSASLVKEECSEKMEKCTYYIIAGIARIDYKGKMEDSYNGYSVVLIKPDSTIVVHGEGGVKPRNYMSRPVIKEFMFDGHDSLKMKAEGEDGSLTIIFSRVTLFNAPFKLCESPAGRVKAIEAGADEKPVRNVFEKPELSENDKKLEKSLRSLRTSLAKEKSVPPYTIFMDRTLYELIIKKPKDKESLKEVYGIGQAKIDRYGDIILKIINGE
jgi:replicative superfamily II helicase